LNDAISTLRNTPKSEAATAPREVGEEVEEGPALPESSQR
jgi:hypothetical protein